MTIFEALREVTKSIKEWANKKLSTEKVKIQKEIAVERERISQLASIPEGSTTGDAELMDIRIGADGTTYPNAGEAVRKQIDNLTDQVENKLAGGIKTINGIYPDENGNVEIECSGGGGSGTGTDGFSPIANVSQTDDGAVISITDKEGTTTATITNGKDGEDGYTPIKGKDYFDGAKGEPGASGVHIGNDEPPENANVWVNPAGEPTSTEDWEFDLDDGTTDTKTVVVVGSDEANANGQLGILSVRQADGTWKEIPAIVGTPGKDGYTPVKGVDYFDGTKGENGTSVTVKSVNESTADGGNNVVTFSDGKTLTVKNGNRGPKGDTGATGLQGPKGDTGATGLQGDPGVYIGTDNPPASANVWVNPNGAPTSTESWEFDMEDGSTDTKEVVVLNSEEATANGHIGVLRVKQNGEWKEIPAIKGDDGKAALVCLKTFEHHFDVGSIANRTMADFDRTPEIGEVFTTICANRYFTIFRVIEVLTVIYKAEVIQSIDIGGATGPQGPAYTLTDTDKNAIAAAVKASLTKENWTFTLKDSSTVTKAVYVG
jgi:hypothetical protein